MDNIEKKEKIKKKKILLILLLLLLLFLGVILIIKMINNKQVKTKTLIINLNNDKQNSGLKLELEPGETHKLDIPSKKGYIFKNWVIEGGNSTIEDNILTMGTEASKITVNWELENYEIIYDLVGGIQNNIPVRTYNIESKTITLEDPTKEYYTFTGWTGTDIETPTKNLVVKKGSTGNKTYKANWTPVTYEINYNLNGGIQPKKAIKEYNIETETFNLPLPSKKGYTFKGWYLNKNLSSQVQTKIEKGTTEDKTYYAKWEIVPYTITYDLSNGSLEKEPVVNYNVESNTIELEEPKKKHYIFTGWTGSNGDKPNKDVSIKKGSTGNKTYKANWTPVTYEINYNLNGGKQDKNPPKEYNIETEDFSLPTPSKKGYTFVGWYDNEELTGDIITIIKNGSHGNKTYYAKWEIIEYTITYDLLDGVYENTPITTYIIETETIKVAAPTKEHYIFTGWTGSNGDKPNKDVSIKKGSTGNKTYKANWTPVTYEINYNLNGGKQDKNPPKEYNVETEEFSLPTPSKKGYTFVGWYDNEELTGDIITIIKKGSYGNKTYYAKWEIIEYTITYNLDGGTLPENIITTYTIENDTFALALPTKKDHSFKGWYTTQDLNGTPNTKIEKGTIGNKIYYAKWKKYKSYAGYDTYDVVKDDAESDSKESLFVANSTGIDFKKESNILNGHGKYLIEETKDDKYPIYYYRGNVENNNMIFGGFCWKIVRTTETGGTKLIYNGIAENGKCTKTGLDTQIGNKIRYNNPYNKFEAVGYAYNGSHTLTAIVSTKIKNEVVFANDVEYKDGIYILKDQYIKDDNFETSREDILKTHHYTCLKTANETCSSIYYVFMSRDKLIFYTTLKNGETVESLIENEIINGNNSKSSTIKNYIDNWYNQNMSSYTENLEDAIWCNDRSIYSLGGWDKNSSVTDKMTFSATARASIAGKPSLLCKNKNDRFTVSSSTGNGALTYPIGLLTADEAVYGGYGWFQDDSTSYLNNGHLWWTMSPSLVSANYSYLDVVYSMLDNVHAGYINSSSAMTSGGVRPSIVLKHGIKVEKGTGTIDDPFIINN